MDTEFRFCNRNTVPRLATWMYLTQCALRTAGVTYMLPQLKKKNPHTKSIQTEPFLIVCAARLDYSQNLANLILAPSTCPSHGSQKDASPPLLSSPQTPHDTEDPTWLFFLWDLSIIWLPNQHLLHWESKSRDIIYQFIF